ncbi:MAG: beta-ketoacyl-ACP reductase [Acidobacteria bacterium]|nr:beta-ketoacyl-ACP reductase [Acidobacteriota bacterium]
MKDRAVLVTGGARGIGRAIVELLAREGASVAFTYRQSREQADQLVEDLNEAGLRVAAFQAEANDFHRAMEVVEQTVGMFGSLDGLVNNAGVKRDVSLFLMKETDWSEVLGANLNGLFNYSKSAAPYFMRRRSGAIVNISSVAGLIGQRGQVNYATTKAGMIGFTKSLAREVAGFNIRVNCVAPGLTDTEMIRDMPESVLSQTLKTIPLGRLGRPEEVASMVCYLLSEKSSYITGHVFEVDGGLAM